MKMFITSSVGKKIMMAVTGQIMIIFIIVHVIGNSMIYSGSLNSYAEHLHALPLLLWINRIVMFTVFSLHVILGITLYLENRASGSGTYAVKKDLRTTFAAKNMIWTGLLTGAFVIYHLLHFTFQVTNPAISAAMNIDAMGRPDVSQMVILSFQNVLITMTYLTAMIALVLHLTHGIQSTFQTLGLNNDDTQPFITKAGSLVAYIVFLGFISVPVLIYFGMVKG